MDDDRLKFLDLFRLLFVLSLLLILPIAIALDGPSMGLIGPGFVWVVLMLSAILAMRRIRRRRVAAVMVYLNQAVSLNLPLPLMLMAAEHRETMLMRPKLRTLRRWIESGGSLESAVDAALPDAPREVAPTIGAGEHTGRLPQTLRRLTQRLTREKLDDHGVRTTIEIYAVATMLLVLTAYLTVLPLVMPKFWQIFDDFGARPPRLWVNSLDFLDLTLIGPAIGLIATWTIFLWFVRESLTLAGMLDGRPAPALAWPRRAWDVLCWRLPPLRSMTCQRDLAVVCETAADALDAGMPLHEAIRLGGQAAGNASLRKRAGYWALYAERGKSAAESAQMAGMPKLIVQMLTGEAGEVSAPSSLRFLGRYYATRFSPLAIFLREMVAPAAIIVTAVVVGWYCYLMFSPIVIVLHRAVETAL